jgi:hypothetical protein
MRRRFRRVALAITAVAKVGKQIPLRERKGFQ